MRALITGGTGGIGQATARALASSGADVVVLGRRHVVDPADDGLAGAYVRFVECDVLVRSQVSRVTRQLESEWGSLDILVNAAGVPMVGGIDALSPEQWDQCLGVNLTSAFLFSRWAIPLMRRNGGGSIVNIASNAGLIARARDPAYSAAKAALVMLTRSMALDHAADGIRVNAVCPGPVSGTRMMDRLLSQGATPATELQAILDASPLASFRGRMITPGEVADLVVYLCSPAAAMVTGAAVAIDGGKSAGIPR